MHLEERKGGWKLEDEDNGSTAQSSGGLGVAWSRGTEEQCQMEVVS